jgi:hypothetical protein
MNLGHATKDQYEQAVRQYQVYLDEVKSDQWDEAARINDGCDYLIEDTTTRADLHISYEAGFIRVSEQIKFDGKIVGKFGDSHRRI